MNRVDSPSHDGRAVPPAPGVDHALGDDHAIPARPARPVAEPARRKVTRVGEPMTFGRWLVQDWAVNKGYPDSQLILVAFRLAQWARAEWGVFGWLVFVPYWLLVSNVLGLELQPLAYIGPRLRMPHPHGIVLNGGVRIGADCLLRHNVTIGNVVRRDGTEVGVASLGDGVELGAGCVVVGAVHVGDHARIGALCVVTKDVPAWGVVVGNPARLVRIDSPEGAPPAGDPR
jgi:serine acetyltransferase